jgi:hypothetical protein
VAEADRLAGIARDNGVASPSTPYRPSPADVAAEHLAARAGDRMLSTEAMRRLRGQIDPDR